MGFWNITEIGAILLGSFLIAGHFADPTQYTRWIWAFGEGLLFVGFLFGLAKFNKLGFKRALVITLILMGIVTVGVYWYFKVWLLYHVTLPPQISNTITNVRV